MATMYSGSDGSVTVSSGAQKGQTIIVTSWQAALQQDVFDASPFTVGDNARTKALGMSTLTGTLTGWIHDNQEPELGDIAAENSGGIAGMVLQSNAGNTFTFKAVVESMNISVVKIGEASVVLSFESTGTVQIA